MEPDDEFFTIDQVKRILRLGNTSVYNLLRSGKLLAKKHGRRTLITRISLDAYKATHITDARFARPNVVKGRFPLFGR
jgi:excisionase family DNA binding protein